MTSTQIPLPLLEPAAEFSRADFLTAPCNAEAVTLIERWASWPGKALLLTGPAACGKTHLGAVWRAESGAAFADGPRLTIETIPALLSAGALLLDHADQCRDEAALFHLLNLAREQDISLLMLARGAPENWGLTRPDLLTRLKALARAAILAPDDALLGALIVKLLSDRQIGPLPASVIDKAVGRIEHSYEAAWRLADALDRRSLAQKGGITAAMARTLLEELGW